MATQSPTLFARCVRCNEPASQVCSSCSNAPGIGDEITGNTYYCNAQCQSANWTAHKSACKCLRTRKALYRAGSLLQQIFYVYREKMFERPVARIEVTGSLQQRNMRMEIYGREPCEVVTDSDFLVPFPTSMCKTLEEKQALLSYLSCSDTVILMHDLIEYMLKGKQNLFLLYYDKATNRQALDIASSILETSVMPNNKNLVALAYNSAGKPDPDNHPHSILNVKLKQGGENYLMDLSAAQNGHFEPIVPEVEYMLRVSSILQCDHFGLAKEAFVRLKESGMVDEGWGFQRGFWDQLKGDVQAWEEEVKIPIQAMLQLPDAAFEIRHKQLVEYLGARLQRNLDDMTKGCAGYKALVATIVAADGQTLEDIMLEQLELVEVARRNA